MPDIDEPQKDEPVNDPTVHSDARTVQFSRATARPGKS